ncbi:hypothetical protein GOB57_22340 [Sinorhizobium meliloti]|nr:hypothetical protein [Sinorhizobium meliloti]
MPSSIVLFDPTSEIFRRPTMQRLFLAVGSLDASEPDVRYLERYLDGPAWEPWLVGRTLHFHPFKVRLNATPRAGLHVTTEWRDAAGEMRYGSNFKIREPGVFVLNPSNVVSSAEEIGSATRDSTETRLIDRVLSERFGVTGGYRSALAMPLPNGALVDPERFFLGAA